MKRTPLKRSNKPIASIGKRGRRLRAGDAAARKLCKLAGECQIRTINDQPCLGQLEDCHIVGRNRTSEELRQSPLNHLAGCTGHHRFSHDNPKVWESWMEANYPGRIETILCLSNGVVEGVKAL